MKRKTNHRRVTKIGHKLVEGPSAVFRISDGDWLESDLHIIIKEGGLRKIETYSLLTEDTMNKEIDFLPPMIRILKWRRSEDLNELQNDEHRRFPKIEVELGTILKSKYEEVNQSFISIQAKVKKYNDYVPYNISTERDSAESKVDYEQEYLDYTINFRNGVQSFEFSSAGNLDDELVQAINSLKELFKESIEVVDKSKWKERYYDLTEEYLEGEIPEWYYEDEMNKKAKS